MDIQAALRDGYSLQEVNEEAARRTGFNYKAALADGYTDDEINSELVKRTQKKSGNVATGVGETALALGTSMVMAPLAGLRGLKTLATGGGVDKAVADIGGVMEEAYQPRTETGQRYAKNTTDVLNLPAEYGGKLGEAIGGNEGRLIGEIAGEFATDMLPFGLLTKGKKGKPTAPQPKIESIADRMEAANKPIEVPSPNTPLPNFDKGMWEQGNLFPDDGTGYATPYDAGQIGTSSPVTPKRSRAQMELPLRNDLPDTINIDEAGVSLRPEDMPYVNREKNAELARLDEAERLRAQQDFLENAKQQEMWATDHPGDLAKNGEMLPPKRELPPELTKQEDMFAKEPFDLAPDGQMPLFKREDIPVLKEQAQLFEPQTNMHRPYTDMRVDDGKGGERPLTRTEFEATLKNLAEQEGTRAEFPLTKKDLDAAFERYKFATSEKQGGLFDVGSRQERTKMVPFKDKPIGKRGFANKQTGAFMLPFGKKPALDQLKKVEGIKDKLRNFFPEDQSVADVIKEHAQKGTPDLDQNFLQRASNHLTKGSLYMAQKTDNPILRVVGEYMRKANNMAMEATGRLIHDNLAPKGRALSAKEKADVWAVQQIAETKGFKLTPEFLAKEGFNQKQIDWVTTHATVMDDMYTRLGESMKAAGLEPVSARVAYLASKARGDFRKLVSKETFDASGKPVTTVVGILGDNTRGGLEKQVAKLKQDHPEYKVGEERYYGGRRAKGTEEGFTQMLDFLSKSDPNIKAFVEHVNDMLTQDAFQYMNAKTHTMQKKGVFGMEGRKLYSDAVKNAEEGMQAQIRYAETMIKWSELSKTIAELKPLLKADNGLDMPLAKQWANEYIQGALGNSPGRLGDALDSVTAAIGKGTGLGTTVPGKVISGMKQYVNGLLLGWANAGFLLANLVQAPRTMPEMARWLQTKGVDVGADIGLGRAMVTLEKEMTGQKLSPIETEAIAYAKKNHVYSSNLFESGNTVKKDLSYAWQKGTQFIASGLESVTRKGTYLAYVHMLDASGVKPKDGLFEAAQNLTDVHMNNYAQAEAPRVYQETGGIGRSAYNLMSFKHNELSRLAMLARELPQGTATPAMVAIASQIAFAGLMGTIAFAEADYLYQKVTGMMGEPTSLTKILLDNPNIPDQLTFGMGAMADVDMTSRMGMQLTPGSAIDLLAPGMGKLGDIAGAAGEMISQPNAYNAANLAREVLPLSVGGILDRTVFETEDGMALNRNKVSASAVRNDADKLWKALGMTGMNESIQKKLSYENQKIDQIYQDKRNKVINGAIKDYYMRGELPANWLDQYVELQGDPEQGKAAMKERITALNVDSPTKEKMKLAASKSITAKYNLLRRMGQEK